MVNIRPIPALYDNYIWLIMHPVEPICAVVDPGDSVCVLDVLAERQLTLAGILITHRHLDHTGGLDAILTEQPVPVFAPYSNCLPQTTHPVKEGDTVEIPGLDVSYTVIETPAHTHEHVCYYGGGALFSGDTLFTGGCGRVFEGTAEQMCRSLDKLTALPGETLVYCGHEYTEKNLRFAQAVEPDNDALKERYKHVQAQRAKGKPTVPATLNIEKQTNPFLRYHTDSVKAAAEKHASTTLTNPIDVFAEIRAWKDEYKC